MMSKKVFFYLVLGLCAIAGAIAYFVLDALASSLNEISIEYILLAIGRVSGAIALILTIISLGYYQKGKRLIKHGISDENYDIANRTICISSNLTIVALPLLFYCIATYTGSINNLIGLICLAILGCLLLINIFMQIKITKLAQDLHPEINASVYDMKFAKKWNDQMDEALKAISEKAAFRSSQLMFNIYPIIALIFLLLSGLEGFSLLPLLVVCLLWFIHICSYGYNAYLIENHPSKATK